MIPFIIMLSAGMAVMAAPEDFAPQKDLKPMLRINWQRAPDLPQGFQDSDGGFIGNFLITVGGFCTGEETPRKPGRYPRGFLKKVWALDIRNEAGGWRPLPDFPGEARQELFAVPVGQSLYCWGGFSYSAPYCYRDGYRLFHKGRAWVWEKLPLLPFPLASAGICAVGSKIYVFGGADYNSERFFTETDREGQNRRLGARLMTLDIRHLSGGWQTLPECPGTPRWVHAMAAVGGKIYIIGGATAEPYSTVGDNWMFDPATGAWSRLRDLPVSSGNFPAGAIVYKNRYLLLVGGYQYPRVANPDGTFSPAYGRPSRAGGTGQYFNDIFVYDTQTNLFGTADPMPINNNLPMAVIRGSTLYTIGGESDARDIDGVYYGHHPDLCLKGRIIELRP